MAKVRILRRQDKAYIELPPEVVNCEELELFQLRDGYYLLSVPLGQHSGLGTPAQAATVGISDAERAVLRKLLSIRFENRTPAHVGDSLSEEEKTILDGLEKKGLVNVFRGRKYKDGVYNISDSAYGLIHPKSGQTVQPEKAQNTSGRKAGSTDMPQQPQSTFGLLRSRGFVVIQDKRDAMALSEQLGSEMKSGAVVGVKGFDGKFYMVTKSYFNSAQGAIGLALKDAMDAASIASAARLEPDGCLAVLRLMAENGDIIEKKRGVFAPV
jgi:hypothetical protein